MKKIKLDTTGFTKNSILPLKCKFLEICLHFLEKVEITKKIKLSFSSDFLPIFQIFFSLCKQNQPYPNALFLKGFSPKLIAYSIKQVYTQLIFEETLST